MKKNAVIVIGGGINAVGVFRNIGRNGIDAISLVQKRDFSCHSRYCKKTVVNKNLVKDINSLLHSLEEIQKNYKYTSYVLIPISDRYVEMCSQITKKLPNSFLLNISNFETTETFINKRKFYSLLKEIKIPHPHTFYPEKQSDLELISEKLKFPLFLKPYNSYEFQRLFQGKKGFTINNKKELEEKFSVMYNGNIKMMVHEIIPGRANNHFFIDGYCDTSGEIKSIFTRQRIHMYPLKWGNSASMVSIKPDKLSSPIKDLVEILETTNYRGIFSAEVKFDNRDNLYKFIEINTRSWAYNLFPSICGINIIKMLFDDLINGHVDAKTDFQINKYQVDFWREVKSIINMIKNEEDKIIDILKEIKLPVSFPLFAIDDPVPLFYRIVDYYSNKLLTKNYLKIL